MSLVFAFAGEIILRDLFYISTNALMIAGGIVLSFMGFTALNKGVFFQAQNSQSLMDLAIVPLASPLIAGPATITATIVKATTLTPHFVSLSVIIAVLINLMIVSFSLNITGFLNKYNLTGALIRITGLFILAMGVDMALKGIKSYF
jgi:multiple antibiotic resistance protein